MTARIRPPDPSFDRRLLPRTGRYSNAQAMRLLSHCYFRDAHTALDLTFGAGTFWKGPRPPGLDVLGNNLDPSSSAELHLDFTDTGLPDESYDLAVYDPPHTADNGKGGIFFARYRGTAKGNQELVEDVIAGALEAWRVARLGIIVKVCDSSHGGEFVMLSYAVIAALGTRPYASITAYRPTGITDPKHRIERVPKSNGAIYLAFRKDGHQHRSFDYLYARQPLSRLADLSEPRRCAICDTLLGDRRSDATTCSDACRQRARRARRRSA